MLQHPLRSVCVCSKSSEACSIGTGTAGLYGRATLVRPCERTVWRQFYQIRNPLFGLTRVARANRPAVPVPMLHGSVTRKLCQNTGVHVIM